VSQDHVPLVDRGSTAAAMSVSKQFTAFITISVPEGETLIEAEVWELLEAMFVKVSRAIPDLTITLDGIQPEG